MTENKRIYLLVSLDKAIKGFAKLATFPTNIINTDLYSFVLPFFMQQQSNGVFLHGHS